MPITAEQQYYFNQTECGCMGRANVVENVNEQGQGLGTYTVTGCEPLGDTYNYCPQNVTYGATGQFIVDFVSPELVNSIGALFVRPIGTGSELTAGQNQELNQRRSKTGVLVIGVVSLILIIGLVTMLGKKTGNKSK